MSKIYDIVLYGATGFTGQFIGEYLRRRHPDAASLRWAIAGRSREKLEPLAEALGVPIILADAADPASIDALAACTRVVIAAVGPYEAYGTPLVKACAQAGTDYVDLCGEPLWMRRMIDDYEDVARQSGARILFSAGFDSLPAELGVWFCQQEALRRFGAPMPRIRGRVRKFVAGPSGGSVASGMSTMKLASQDPAKAALLADPFALTPGFAGLPHPDVEQEAFEADVGKIGPFSLGPTDMKNVHRSNFLMGHPYGADFVYDEMLVDPAPPAPRDPASLPRPGEGPSAEMMAVGCFDILFIGSDAKGNELRNIVSGACDPGYVMTSRMISETALCLLASPAVAPGIWTPGAALGAALVERLSTHAEVTFALA